MPALVSIIIPTYNRADLVAEAIESALGQSYPAREVIVVDDGSTDGTPAVLARYGDRIRSLRTGNRGCAAARNAGVGLARGAYLAFLDSDDVAVSEKLAAQVPVLEERAELGFVYGPILLFGPALHAEQVEIPLRPTAEGSVAEELFLTTRIGFGSVLLRRDAVERAGGFDATLRFNEDTDLLLRVAVDWKAAYLPLPTVRQRWHPGRKSLDEVALRRAVLRSTEGILAARPEFAARLGSRGPARRAALHQEIAEALARRGRIGEAREAARAGFRLRPSAALAAWRLLLGLPPLVPIGLALQDGLARGVGFLRARLRRA